MSCNLTPYSRSFSSAQRCVSERGVRPNLTTLCPISEGLSIDLQAFVADSRHRRVSPGGRLFDPPRPLGYNRSVQWRGSGVSRGAGALTVDNRGPLAQWQSH